MHSPLPFVQPPSNLLPKLRNPHPKNVSQNGSKSTPHFLPENASLYNGNTLLLYRCQPPIAPSKSNVDSLATIHKVTRAFTRL